jgi:hypothetical protein
MTSVLLLSSLLAQAPAAEAEKPGVIRGTVVSATTKEPIRRADVTLQPMVRAGASLGVMGPPPGGQKAVTDSEGNFAFTGVAPGNFMVMAQRTGYVIARYGARTPLAPGTQISVKAGQEVTGVKIEMIPQGVIAGRVLDDEGEPLQGVMVMAMGSASSTGAARRGSRFGRLGMMSQGLTDDRGEFRIANLSPGRITLQFMPGRWGGMPVAAPPTEGAEEMGYVTTYYPGVTDPSQAANIEITPGAELSGFEVRLKRTRVYRVRGHILDPSGQPAKNYAVSVMPKGLTFGPLMAQQFHRTPDGGFEIHNVAPGSYLLTIRTDGGRGQGTTYSEPLEVGSQNIDGLVIRLQPAVSVTGQVIQRGEQKLDVSGMRVMLGSSLPMFSPGGQPMVKEDGTFVLENVSPGKYRVSTAAPAGSYIESIHYGETDVTGAEFEVSGSPAPIRVTVRAGGGSVSGVVTEDGKPASGMVFLIPSDPAKRIQMLIRTATPDQNGAFTISNLRPGDYLAFALSETDWGVWEEPDDFRAIESKAKKVSLKDGSNETVELTIAK